MSGDDDLEPWLQEIADDILRTIEDDQQIPPAAIVEIIVDNVHDGLGNQYGRGERAILPIDIANILIARKQAILIASNVS